MKDVVMDNFLVFPQQSKSNDYLKRIKFTGLPRLRRGDCGDSLDQPFIVVSL